MADDGHLSIGDVLEKLRDEYPDLTISKIRFLESQGLIEPERTVSGYRKFYAGDVERLRWILQQQKSNFLPLKVIKERLEEADRSGRGLPADDTAPDAEAPAPAPAAAQAAPARRPRGASSRSRGRADEPRAEQPSDAADHVRTPPTGASLTRPELARAAELDDDELAALEEYGLVHPSYVSRDRVLFDEDALAVAIVAAGFLRHGLEPRHLRMYRGFAEREVALFEQVLLPYRRQRNPEARARAEAVLGELADLGRRLRGALLRQAARRSLGS